jgi:hypothetical protein
MHRLSPFVSALHTLHCVLLFASSDVLLTLPTHLPCRRLFQCFSHPQSPQFAAPSCVISVRRQVKSLIHIIPCPRCAIRIFLDHHAVATCGTILKPLLALTRAHGGFNGRPSLPTIKPLLVYSPISVFSLSQPTLPHPSQGFKAECCTCSFLSHSCHSASSWWRRPPLGSLDSFPLWALFPVRRVLSVPPQSSRPCIVFSTRIFHTRI